MLQNNLSKNKKNSLFFASITYLIFFSVATFLLFPIFKKLRQENFRYKEKTNTYINLKIPYLNEGQIVNCSGETVFKAQVPLVSLFLFKNYLLTSSVNQKIIAINLENSREILSTEGFATYFYSDSNKLLTTDFLNNKIVKININSNSLSKETVFEKIGHPSSIIKDNEGNWLIAGYASGNIFKITGSEKTIFATDLDKIIGLAKNQEFIYLARYNAIPSLVAIDKNQHQKIIEIEKDKLISDLTSEGQNILLIYYSDQNQSKLGKIENNNIQEISAINCPFPLKIAINKEFVFYTSLKDSEGKIYRIKNNLQITGK